MKYSLILCVKNGGEQLRTCLDHMAVVASDDDLDVVLVDNGSTDGKTLDALKDFAAMAPCPCSVVQCTKAGNSAGRNAGLTGRAGGTFCCLLMQIATLLRISSRLGRTYSQPIPSAMPPAGFCVIRWTRPRSDVTKAGTRFRSRPAALCRVALCRDPTWRSCAHALSVQVRLTTGLAPERPSRARSGIWR